MFGQKFFPYSTLQELNLDWILTKVKNILRFVPDDGAVGQILRRTKDGAEWSNETGGGGAVSSVNGQTGDVVLDASDVGALPDSYTAPVTSVNTKTGAVVLDKTDIGLGNVANVAQYSASNPPPYPVTSVNTKTGAVVLDKTDVGLGNVANEAQYSASNPPPYPVTSVNGQTGAVTVGSIDTLFTGSIGLNTSSPLTHPITDYDLIMLEWKVAGTGQTKTCVLNRSSIVFNESQIDGVLANTNYYNCVYFNFTNASTILLSAEYHLGWAAPKIVAVRGIKF